MHFNAVSSRCRVERVQSLPNGAAGEYDLDRGVIRILASVSPLECPRIAAEAVVRAEIDRTMPELSRLERERLALRLGPVVARFSEDMELAGGRLAFFRMIDNDGEHKWRGMVNGSQRAMRPCANPTCDYQCAPGSVQFGDPEHHDGGQLVCRVVTDCEWCGLWTYAELANAAGKPSGEMLADEPPRPMDRAERLDYVKSRGVVGTIYVD